MWIFLQLFVLLICLCLSSGNLVIDKASYKVFQALETLQNKCLDYFHGDNEGVTYRWCYAQKVSRSTMNLDTGEVTELLIGKYLIFPLSAPLYKYTMEKLLIVCRTTIHWLNVVRW